MIVDSNQKNCEQNQGMFTIETSHTKPHERDPILLQTIPNFWIVHCIIPKSRLRQGLINGQQNFFTIHEL